MSPSLVLNHYTSGTGLAGILDTGTIWATNIHQLNDAMEFRYALDLAKMEIAKAASDSNIENSQTLSERLGDLIDRCGRLSVYVTCFSEVRDSLSQWRGYCPPGFGYSIGFDAEHLRTAAQGHGFVLGQCIYDHHKQNEIITSWAKKTFEYIVSNLNPSANTSETEEVVWPRMMSLLVQAPFIKHSSFSEEREWRLSRVVRSDDPQLRLRSGKQMLIRYLPISLSLSKESDIIWDICVGPTPHPELATDAITHYFNRLKIRNGIGPSQSPYRSW